MARPVTRRRSSEDQRGSRDRLVVSALLAWFDASARELPWRPAGRAGSREPYRTLVSEFMLQQTQASRVAERLGSFMARFPTLGALAAADEHDVLAEWSGLGYYRRARNLHAAARAVAKRHGGSMPGDVEALLALPGVGKYTAGAIASLAFNRAVPAVDGNVSRVILRLEGKDLPSAGTATLKFASERAAALLATPEGERHAGAVNEALIELGATVCVPRSPWCGACQVSGWCRGRARGVQDRIPRARPAARQKEMAADCVVVRDGAGRLLVERRGEEGLWAGMWQTPTHESGPGERPPVLARLPGMLGLNGVRLAAEVIDEFTHATTHRLVKFRVWEGRMRGAAGMGVHPTRSWKTQEEIARLAISNPQRRILLGQ